MVKSFVLMSSHIISVLCALALVNGCAPSSMTSNTQSRSQLSTKQPNILFIYTDDQAPWSFGASGNPQAITPNMDKLASAGMMFPNAYTTTPVCSPSRAGLLVSRYGYELGIDDWINTRYRPAAMSGLEPTLGLETELATWPQLLQNAGYFTALIGKWHLGELAAHHPHHYGYDKFIGFKGGGTKTVDPVININGIKTSQNGLTADVLTMYAIQFLKENKDKRFALSLHYRAPHTKWLPVSEADAQPYNDMDMLIPNPDFPNLNINKTKRFMKEYLSSVRSVDRNLGKIIQALKTYGLEQNTLVIFTSDHGYNIGHNGIWHKGNGHWILQKPVTNSSPNIPTDQRPNLFDNSIKVPLIISLPSMVKPNSVNMSSFSNLDWLPTLADIANINIPEKQLVRGTSMMGALLEPKLVVSDDYYAAYSTKHQSITGMRMYSDGRYKLTIDFLNRERDEMYHLESDPSESANIIESSYPEHTRILEEFTQIIYAKMQTTNDPLYKMATPIAE